MTFLSLGFRFVSPVAYLLTYTHSALLSFFLGSWVLLYPNTSDRTFVFEGFSLWICHHATAPSERRFLHWHVGALLQTNYRNSGRMFVSYGFGWCSTVTLAHAADGYVVAICRRISRTRHCILAQLCETYSETDNTRLRLSKWTDWGMEWGGIVVAECVVEVNEGTDGRGTWVEDHLVALIAPSPPFSS